MSMPLSGSDCSPERPISELCVNLEDQFMNTQELSKAEGMRVYARIRPMLDSEIEAGYEECIGIINEQTVRAIVPTSSAKYKSGAHLGQDIIEDFKFTAAYGPSTGQFVFFEESMMNTMQNFIEGQNSLVFSYGTTGSGKTFTLQGDTDNPGIIPLSLHLFFSSIEDQLLDRILVKPEKFADVTVLNDNEVKKEFEIKEQLLSSCEQEEWNHKKSATKKSLAMVLCETFSEKFEADACETTLCPEEMAQAQAAAVMKELGKQSADQQTGYCNIWVSFVEIYNESIYDLLQPSVNQRPRLTLGEDKNGDVYVKGLREVCVSSSYEALKLLNFGQRNLNIASTKLNYKSSRSHCIFTVKVVRILDPENMTYAKVNRLSFCDLAGSERAAKSQTTGMRLKEAGCINTSLLVLGRCLEQLRLKPSLREKKLIPFRESKLTRLFSGFFTGRGKAVMVTNASPSELTFDETLHALRFSALAKELIINDSYIATASSTLQSISNMWTNTKANNISASSDRSISFEDSVDEMHGHDELIEKLLDLAESLRNNLEREKREKAELEMKIRQDVCEEYAEYSDELLENQRQTFVEERENIREIYQKRIDAMEKMYENIIKDYKLQLEEGFSSEEESFEVVKSEKEEKSPKRKEVPDTDELMENADATSKVTNESEESEKTKEELYKTVDYSLSLETELETLRNELDSVKLQLQNALKDNEEMKKELDAYKIDCCAYRTDNNSLLAEKSAFELDMMSLTKDLASITREREDLKQDLAESESRVASQNNEIQKLLTRIDELVKTQEESSIKYEKSVEEADLRAKKTEEVLISVREKLDSAVKLNEEKEKKLEALEIEQATLKKELPAALDRIKDLTKKLELAFSDLELEKSKFNSNNAEMLKTIEELTEELDKKKSECLNEENEMFSIQEIKLTLEEKLSSVTKELESEGKKLSDAQKIISSKEEEIISLIAKIDANKKEIEMLKELNDELRERKNSETELEKIKYSEELDTLSKKLDDAKEIISTQEAEIISLVADKGDSEKEIVRLKELNNELKEQMDSKTESETLYREKLDTVTKKLEDAEVTISKQIEEMNSLIGDSDACKSEIEKLMELSNELETKMNAEIESKTSAYKEELDILKQKLGEAENTISEQKEEIEELMAYKNESEKLTYKIDDLKEELEEKSTPKFESVSVADKEELDILKKSLEEAQITVNKQKEEINILLDNSIEIERLKTLNNQLEEEVKFKTEAETSYKQELDTLSKKIEEAENTINTQKDELNILIEDSNANKNEIEKLKELNNELEEKITLAETVSYKEVFDSVSRKFDEAQVTISNQKEEINTLLADCNSNKDELESLSKKFEDSHIIISNQKEEINTLIADCNSNKKEIERLSELNKEVVTYKEELESLSKKFDEAQITISNQKEEINTLQAECSSNKKEIGRFSELNKEAVTYKEELESLRKKLDEAQITISNQKEEINTLQADYNSNKKEIERLSELNNELEKRINSNSELENLAHQQEVDSLKKKLEEADLTVNKQKEELDSLLNDKNIILELVQVLQNCELHATNHIEKMDSCSKQLKTKLQNLMNQAKTDNEDHEKMCNTLYKLINVLQKCEVFASTQAKELHSSSIKHVEQLMDLEKCIKAKEGNIENLKNEYAVLQKKLKESESTFKKQLQAEKQQYKAEIDDIKTKQTTIEKENEILKQKLNQVEDTNKKLSSEVLKITSEKSAIESQLKLQEDKKLPDVVSPVDQVEKSRRRSSRSSTGNKEEESTEQLSIKEEEEKKNKKSAKQVQVDKKSPDIESSVEQVETSNKRSSRRDKHEEEKKNKNSAKQKSKKGKLDTESEKQIPDENTSPVVAIEKIVDIFENDRKKSEKILDENVAPVVAIEKIVDIFEKDMKKSDKKPMEGKEGKVVTKQSHRGKRKPLNEKTEENKKTKIYEEIDENSSSKDTRQNHRGKRKLLNEKTEENNKTKIYEEMDENSSSKDMRQEIKRTGRRELRCLDNIGANVTMEQNKDSSSAKTKASKRMAQNENKEKQSEKTLLKRIKLHDGNENIAKPQNLAIRLLKASVAVNDIPLPSPRMTRGRKKLATLQAKNIGKIMASPRTVRS